MKKLTPLPFYNVNITDGFWKNRMDKNENITIYSVRDRFRDTGRFEAFKFNWKEGSDIPKPHIFWDSDVAKWMESVAYILARKSDAGLKADVEELITLMEKNQCEDGYFNIAHTVVFPEKRFKVRDNHELYCLGHFIEAAVAWKTVTGCDRLVKIVDRYIDYVIKVFCEEKSAVFVTPGHEEIELALIKLYRLTGVKKYLELAMFFIDERGKHEENLTSWCNSSYNQSHLPVRKQNEAMGHCVRACYLYSAMADAAKETGDEEMFSACKKLLDDIVIRKMYITGGIGSSHKGEAFTVPYDLPPDTAYAETCASIALMMFADRMKDIEPDSRYADIVEREIFNGIISGVSLDGKAFFYENPLSICLADRIRHTSVTEMSDRLPITLRKEVFDCSCCPPNLTRFFASVGDHFFSYNSDSIYIHQFASCKAEIDGTEIEMKTLYPVDGKIEINVINGKGKNVYVRIPGWARDFSSSHSYTSHNGYACFEIADDNVTVSIDILMTVSFMASASPSKDISGKTAVMYGPVVYCAEGIDNVDSIFTLRLETAGKADVRYSEEFGCNIIKIKAYKKTEKELLYVPVDEIEEVETTLSLIPYFAFANRGESDMNVWFSY